MVEVPRDVSVSLRNLDSEVETNVDWVLQVIGDISVSDEPNVSFDLK